VNFGDFLVPLGLLGAKVGDGISSSSSSSLLSSFLFNFF